MSLFPFLSFCGLFSFVFESSSYFLISFALIMPLHLHCFFLSLGVILFCIPLLALSCPVIIHALPSNLCSLRISIPVCVLMKPTWSFPPSPSLEKRKRKSKADLRNGYEARRNDEIVILFSKKWLL